MYILSLIQRLQPILLGWFGDSTNALLITNLILVIFTTVIFWVIYIVVFRLFRKLSKRLLKDDSQLRPLRIQQQVILSAKLLTGLLNRTFLVVSWVLRLFIVLTYLNTLLSLFTWTRDVSVSLAGLLREAVGAMWRGIIGYLPNLFAILIIVVIALLMIRLTRLVFDGVERNRIKVPGFYPEWSGTTFNLLRLFIMAMALVVVFPYLPGSGSPAFQGVSIFLGLLLSLGSTSAVANVVSGIVITYTRAFQTGDHVRLSDTEGEIVERSAFVTRIRTPKNVEVSVPNSSVMSDKVINYSAQARHSGITLHTGVTIGYDVPWTTVQKLLLTAAGATGDIERDPAPFVRLKALDDNYVEYELNATTRRADLRPGIYSELHVNILDAFHSAGVEITSPHYRAVRDGNEPAMAAVIPRPSSESA
jgi:small-conductance mechanosensitive channel